MNSSNNYRLMSNISLTSTDKLSSSKVLGTGKTFDGNGHSITGLDKALFSLVNSNAKIQNLSINGNVSNRAILANTVYSGVKVNDVVVSGSVNSTADKTGALIGSVSGSNVEIQRCSSNASVTANGRNYVGGLIGSATGTSTSSLLIKDCSVTGGTVTGNKDIGGMIGSGEYTTIQNCITNNNAIGTFDNYPNNWGCDVVVGGLAGYLGNSDITYCETRGSVTSATSIGGSMFGYIASSSASHLNGNANVSLNANGSMTDPSNGGGLMGAFMGGILNSIVRDSNFTGTLDLNGYTGTVGAFIGGCTNGSADTGSSVTNCYTSAPGVFSKDEDLSYTQSSTPISNTVTVASPNILVSTTVNDSGNFGQMFDMITAGNYVVGVASDPTNGHENDTEWLTNMVNSGCILICKQGKDSKYYETSVAIDTGLQEVSDEKDLRKAEAKYEADMKKIDLKDRRYDTQLAALDNERNAIKAEMETLKTVAKDNVERTFLSAEG